MSELVRDFRETINERVASDQLFAIELFNEATELMLNGEPETARLILRDLVNSTVGFEELAKVTNRPSKSLHRMLSARGNPTMENLMAIYRVLKEKLNVSIKVQILAEATN